LVNSTPEYVRLTLHLSEGSDEAAHMLLFELPTAGWQELPGTNDVVFWLTAQTLEDSSVRQTLDRLRVVGELVAAPETGGWEERWRRFHQPVRVGSVLVRPPWSPPDPEAFDVLVDVGMAFGTGAHQTTRQCLRLLQQVAPGSLLDVGCGTGVLSVAGVRLGYQPVHAVDNDELAISAAAANALLNSVHVDFALLDATDPGVSMPDVEVVVANVALRPIIALGERWGGVTPAAATHGPRDVILAGLLAAQIDEALAAWPAYAVAGRLRDKEWRALHLRPADIAREGVL
jgi:ribosomal protein L11 methyltransferase